MNKDNQAFLRIRDFLSSYIVFPNPVFADICALWVIGTHVYKRFDSFGYLVITATTKRAGKTILAELMAMLSRDAKNGTSMTASVMRRLVSKGSTLFFDEAESLNSEAASAQREYLNIGYRAGQSVFMPGNGPDEVIEYPAYGPKCFILIGDVNDTLRDRSITVELRRAIASKKYRRSEAEREAEQIQGQRGNNDQTELTNYFENQLGEDFDAYDAYDALEGREAEIWTAILTLASRFAPSRLDAIIRTAVDLSAIKQTTEKRRFSEIRREAEKAAGDSAYSERAMRDLSSVFHQGEKTLSSEAAIERMKQIATAPWRTYKGTGLTAVLLSDLLSVFGVNTRSVKIKGKVVRGFQRADVVAGRGKVSEHKASEV